ncbi:MAG: hypothetical protein KDD69_17230, partial [Bdellovibrionales bacterium]|nr:hypothetical protein [Bdellovibrionales bacterium]
MTIAPGAPARTFPSATGVASGFDWPRIVKIMLLSRAIDAIEETELYPNKQIAYQFSARGHELGQVLLGSLLDRSHDAASAYYRSRPLLLTLGLSVDDALAAPLGRSGGFSDGRDIGVVCNLPNPKGPVVLPMAGDVGSQYTPSSGWAEAIQYHEFVLGNSDYEGCIAVVLGGEGSVATNGFWSALTMATTLSLPQLFFIEDNGYAISVPSDKQTPGGNIAENLRSFRHLHLLECDGTDPIDAAERIREAVQHVRLGRSPALIRLEVPRLAGHSGQDTQAYKPAEELAAEQTRDPLPRLKAYLVPTVLSEAAWNELAAAADAEVREALGRALNRPEPDPRTIARFRFVEHDEAGEEISAMRGGLPL